ncbi:MAG: endo-1,4-beta-xylanase [Lentisphaeria bacterium]|jgi:hypothetical protein
MKATITTILSLILFVSMTARAADTGAPDPRDDASPWGVGSGAEWAKDYPKFNPMVSQAGAKWLRLFEEWQTVQPRQGEWKWEGTDKIVANARANHLHLIGGWCYFAPWASADGGTRKGPIKDMQHWRDYVSASVSRYKGDIKYWEVWNEFNGSFYVGKNKVKDYADLVVAAYDAAKKADPTAQVGMSVASSDIGFLDLVIKAGAANHFDFICVHPYENIDAVRMGDEMGFLGLARTAREMLAANKQNANTPLWITEVGSGAPPKPEPKADARQADILLKSYILSLAQGFSRVFWFEVRGPTYGPEDFNLIRTDWSPRPSYQAYQTMAALLGAEPKYLGWLDVGQGGYGFLFKGQNGNVLVAWAPLNKEKKATFSADVEIVGLDGKATPLAAGKEVVLNNSPMFIRGDLADLASQAAANLGKPYPWDGDHANAAQVNCRLGEPNRDDGLTQITLPRPDQIGCTVPAEVDGVACRRVVSKNHDNGIIAFRADTRYIPFGVRTLDITVVARRAAKDKPAEISLTYETLDGLKDFKNGIEPWTVPAGDGWHEHTWRVRDACFINKWGAHLVLVSPGPLPDIFLKEVSVKKIEMDK